MELDHIRFKIAQMCNGTNTMQDIVNRLKMNLNHSEEYIGIMVADTLNRFDEKFLLYWRAQKRPDAMEYYLPEKEDIEERGYLSAPQSIIWELTHRCNLKCKHCFSSSGAAASNELTTDEIRKGLDSFERNKVFQINFTGGEPLLRNDFFEILDYATAKKIAIDFSTNGFLIDQTTVDRLKDTNIFNIQISLDGIGELHDRFRGVDGLYRKILDGIEILKRSGFNVVISTTINKTNLRQLGDIIDKAQELGVSVFKTTLFIPIGRGKANENELQLSRDDVRSIAYILKEKRALIGDRLQIQMDSCYPWLLEENRPEETIWKNRNVGCSAGSSTLFITAEGKVAPCPFLRHMTIGNLRSEDLKTIWNSDALECFRTIKPEDLKGRCHNCEFLGSECYGGCRAAAFAESGDMLGEDPLCWKNNA